MKLIICKDKQWVIINRGKFFQIPKACLHYFLSNSYFSPNDSPSKAMKNVFYFTKKALLVFKIFNSLYFCLPPVSHCLRQ